MQVLREYKINGSGTSRTLGEQRFQGQHKCSGAAVLITVDLLNFGGVGDD